MFSIYYRPEEVGIAPYSTELAEHFAREGHSVTVVCGMPHYPEWRVREGYRHMHQMHERVNGVDVYRYRNWLPARQSTLRRVVFEVTFLLSAARFRPPTADLVLGVTPAFSGSVLAYRAARSLRAPCGAIVQDLMGRAAAQSGIAGGKRLAGIFGAIESAVFRRVDGLAIVSERFRPHLISAGVSADKIFSLPNWAHTTRQEHTSEVRAELGWGRTQEVVLHAGTLGLKQGLENVVAAARLAEVQRPNLLFVLLGDGSERAVLVDAARDLPNVRFMPVLPKEKFTEALSAADVLLVSERTTNLDMSLPSKLTSYFVAGRPVLATVNPRGATGEVLGRTGAGLVVQGGSPRLLLAGAIRLLDDSDFAAQVVSAADNYLERELHPDQGLERAEGFVRSLLSGGGLNCVPVRANVQPVRYSHQGVSSLRQAPQ